MSPIVIHRRVAHLGYSALALMLLSGGARVVHAGCGDYVLHGDIDADRGADLQGLVVAWQSGIEPRDAKLLLSRLLQPSRPPCDGPACGESPTGIVGQPATVPAERSGPTFAGALGGETRPDARPRSALCDATIARPRRMPQSLWRPPESRR